MFAYFALKFFIINLCLLCFAQSNSALRVHFNSHYVQSEKWIEVQKYNTDSQPFTFVLVLSQNNLDVLHKRFEEITTPNSPTWRNWWSIAEAKNLIKPKEEDKNKITTWLRNKDTKITIEDIGDALFIKTTKKLAEELFETTLSAFQSTSTEEIIFRTKITYSIPEEIEKNIDFILGLSEMPNTRKSNHKNKETKNQFQKIEKNSTEEVVVPWVINQKYNIKDINVNQSTSIGIVQYKDNISFLPSDLSYFQNANNLPQNNVSLDHIIGPFNSPPGEYESSLDIQYASGLTVNATDWFWTVKGWVLDFTLEFQRYQLQYGSSSVPSVLSMSWGYTEDDQCEFTACYDSKKYVERCNVEFEIITGSGITILAASGDDGSAGQDNANCTSSEPLDPLFPAVSPYVLAVGATMFVPSNQISHVNEDLNSSSSPPPICDEFECVDANSVSEIACMYPKSKITSGGGFSKYSSTPSWQSKQVRSYLQNPDIQNQLPPQKYYNSSNRAIPDISIIGNQFLIRLNHHWNIQDGTSCSTPVWAAIIALLNQKQHDLGLPTLGFINPLLYLAAEEDPSSFNDITVGNNHCTMEACCEYGYPTAVGYDAVSGLGSINFANLANYIQKKNMEYVRKGSNNKDL